MKLKKRSIKPLKRRKTNHSSKASVSVLFLLLALFTTVIMVQSQQTFKQRAQTAKISPTYTCLGPGSCQNSPINRNTPIGQLCSNNGDCAFGLVCKERKCQTAPSGRNTTSEPTTTTTTGTPNGMGNITVLTIEPSTGTSVDYSSKTSPNQSMNSGEETTSGSKCSTKKIGDFKGECSGNLTCNTKDDQSTNCIRNNQCSGTCLVPEKLGGTAAMGKQCKTKQGDTNGIHGTCGGTTVICDTKKDNSTQCKKSGNCTGTCQSTFAGYLPGQKCTKINKNDWQGGCVNGQKCDVSRDKSSTCKTSGKCTGTCAKN